MEGYLTLVTVLIRYIILMLVLFVCTVFIIIKAIVQGSIMNMVTAMDTVVARFVGGWSNSLNCCKKIV